MLRDILKNRKIKAIMKESWSMSWAMTLIMFFIFLIGLADVYIAGKFGKETQAAYGLSFQLYFIFFIIAGAFSVGTSSVISRSFTSKSHDDLRVAISTSLAMIAIIGIVLGAIGFCLGGGIIRGFRAPASIRDFAAVFVRLYFIGLPFHYIMVNTNAVLRACKMIRKSLVTMGIVCSLNVGLNFYLSLHTPLGFKGIAISTVISLMLGTLLNLYHVISFLKRFSHFSRDILKRIVAIGWPAGIMHIFWQFGSMALFLILSRLPRDNIEIMAAFTNGLKIESAIFLPAFAFNMANAVVVGNLLGKKEEEDALHAGVLTAMIGVLIVSAFTAVVMLNARQVASVLSDNAIVIQRCVQYIRIALIFEPVMAWGVILAGGLNGAGDTRSVMVMVSLCIWLLRIPAAYIFGVYFGMGAIAVWWAMNLSVVVQSILLSKRYFSKRWIALARETA